MSPSSNSDDGFPTGVKRWLFSVLPDLLALAVHRSAALATFDRKVRIKAVPGAVDEHLSVITPSG